MIFDFLIIFFLRQLNLHSTIKHASWKIAHCRECVGLKGVPLLSAKKNGLGRDRQTDGQTEREDRYIETDRDTEIDFNVSLFWRLLTQRWVGVLMTIS